MNKQIEAVRATGKGEFIPSVGESMLGRDLDGTYAAKWLRSQGYEVVSNRDTGRNGLAITACGMQVSTNGYVCKAQPNPPRHQE